MPRRITGKLKFIWELTKTIVVEFIQDNALSYSASVAFFTVFSLPGVLIMVVLTAGSVFGEDEVKGKLFSQIRGLVGPESAEQIRIILENIQASDYSLLATLIGLGTLIFGATTIFVSMQDGLNAVWGLRPKPRRALLKWFFNRSLSFAMVVSIGFLMMVSLVVDTILVFFHEWLSVLLTVFAVNVIEMLHAGISVLFLTFIFMSIYKVLPHGKVRFRPLMYGSLLATLLFLGGKYLLGFYLVNTQLGTAYGAAGSLVLLLIWVYYSSIILLLGAEFIDVYSRMTGRAVQPGQQTVKLLVKEKEKSE